MVILSADAPSFRNLLPGFVLAAGTQVVLKVAKALPDSQLFKPAGSVGVVVASPPDNRLPYVVRFTDGAVVQGLFDELIAHKVNGENIGICDLDWPFQEARLAELEAGLDQAFHESQLPEDRDRKPVNGLLVRLRLGQ